MQNFQLIKLKTVGYKKFVVETIGTNLMHRYLMKCTLNINKIKYIVQFQLCCYVLFTKLHGPTQKKNFLKI